MPSITIITASYNSAETIEETIHSVLSQKGVNNIEHIVVDGMSSDGTAAILKKYQDKLSRLIIEKDQGVYEAMNKGIKAAQGEIIGFLNADDLYENDQVLAKVVNVLAGKKTDSLYGDLIYVKQTDINKKVRYWRAGQYKPGIFRSGWMPPHPAFFVRKKIYEQYGGFNTNLPLAADYELMLRLLEKARISTTYLEEVLVKMRLGGISNKNIRNKVRNYYENLSAWQVNGLKPAFYTMFLKRLRKLPQYFQVQK